MDRVLNVQFPKLYLVQSRCSLKVKWMKEVNSTSRLDKMTSADASQP